MISEHPRPEDAAADSNKKIYILGSGVKHVIAKSLTLVSMCPYLSIST